jgi:hypothetical protein
MPVNIISKIKPQNNGAFPTYDDIDGYGGYQVRENVTDRNSIPTLNRKAGMLVYLQSDGYFYQLGTGLTNGDWAVANLGSGGGGGSSILSGDVTGNTSANTVINIRGASVPAAGALTTGNTLRVSGVSSLTYSALNLAGGSNFVTGVLPIGNQAAQILGGDLSGTTTLGAVVSLTGATGKVNIASTGNAITWNTSTTTPTIKQADKVTPSGTGEYLTVQAQNETGTTSIGGGLILSSGSGTSTHGSVQVQIGGTDKLVVNATGVVTVLNLNSVGIVHTDGSGNLSTSAIANADINAAAAIAVTKLAAGTSAQILLNNGTPAPAWATVSGDATISNTGSVAVVKVQGNTITSGALVKGQFFVASSTSNWAATTLSGDISESNTTAGLLTNIAIQGNAIQSGTNGSAQDGYVLTWVNGSNQYQTLPVTTFTMPHLLWTGGIEIDGYGLLFDDMVRDGKVTTDATVTTIHTYAVSTDGDLVEFEAKIVAKRLDIVGDAAIFVLRGAWLRQGSTLTVVDDSEVVKRSSTVGAAAWTVVLDATSTTNIRIIATGDANKVIHWGIRRELLEIS